MATDSSDVATVVHIADTECVAGLIKTVLIYTITSTQKYARIEILL